MENVAEAMPPLSPTFSRASRRQVLQVVHRLLVLATYPAKISANPLPKGFLPKVSSEKAKTSCTPTKTRSGWKKHFAWRPSPTAPVLRAREESFVERYNLARHLRKALEAAGVTRPQLFEMTETRLALRAHDLRASFVTISLALGKTEAWITDRTGHRSSQMIYR